MMYVLIDGSVEIFVDLSDDEAWLDTMEEGRECKLFATYSKTKIL